MAFRLAANPMEEMARLERLRLADPKSAANLMANGALLLEYATRGDLRALQASLEHLNEGDVLSFHAARMFRAGCASRRLDVLRFLLANGFDLQHASVRGVLLETLEGIAEDDTEAAEHAQALIRFLLDHGVDVNWQRKGDLLSALHIACRKGLYGIGYLLLLYGADANAIALHDEMPLTCAQQARQAPERSERQKHDVDRLIELLTENGARETWRRQPETHAACVPRTATRSNQQGQSYSSVAADAKAPGGAILSFSSSSVSFHSSGSGRDGEAPTRGLMVDTPL